MTTITWSYKNITERLMPNGFNVQFMGLLMVTENGETEPVGKVDNAGDGGSNTYFFADKKSEELFKQKAKEVITDGEFLEVEDEFVERLYLEAVGYVGV